MRYRISEIKIGPKEYADAERRLDHIEHALKRQLASRFAGKSGHSGKKSGKNGKNGKKSGRKTELQITDVEIIRESIDARRKPDVKAVYTLDFDCDQKLRLPEGGREEYRPPVLAEPEAQAGTPADSGVRPVIADSGIRPVIAGFGPCGIFAALILAEAGLRPIVIERGRPVQERVRDVNRFWEGGALDPESNVQFGEGGAGTFSDGKLTTGIRDVRIRKVLQEFVAAGADPQILYQQKPHIGTDRLREIIPKIRQKIEALGGEVRFEARLTGIEAAEQPNRPEGSGEPAEGPAIARQLTGIRVSHRTSSGRQGEEVIAARHLVLAIGHSARDTFRMLRELELPMEQKPFSIGVRIEHPQERIDEAQYGDPKLAEVFGPAVYKLHCRCGDGRGVYTFCMCPGGKVINASSERDGAVTNGMSESGRDSGTANAALLVDVRPEDFESDDPLAGVEFQRKYERLALEQGARFAGGLPRTEYGAFRDLPEDPVRTCLPAFAGEAIAEAMPQLGRKLHGFDAEDAVMTAVETRSSSPVRILRDERLQSGIRGLLPAGEGPGYAGGIMSAAVDGIRAAEQIIREYGGKEQ